MKGLLKLKKAVNVILIITIISILIVGCSTETDKAVNNPDMAQEQSEEKLDKNNESSEASNEEQGAKQSQNDDIEGIASLPEFKFESDKVVKVMTNWTHPKLGDPDMDLWPQEVRLLKKLYDVDVEYIKLPSAEIPTKQAAMVMAGEPADVVSLLAYADYPNSFTNGLYEPIDDLLPLDSKVFDVVRNYIDTLRINGEAYWAPHVVRPTPPNFIYNKALLEEAGLEDPSQLVARNEWTWDTFFDYCKELTVDRDGDGTTDQYGGAGVRAFVNNMVNTIGYPISKIDQNNKVEINLRDEGLMAYYEFLRKIGPFGEGVFHPLSFKAGDSEQKIKEEFLNGNIGFYYGWDNGFAVKNTFRPMFEKGELGQTILPKYPNADQQYTGVQVSGMGISKGAKHPQTAAAYITLYMASYFKSAKEVVEDNRRISSNMEKELGVDLSTLLDSKYNNMKFDIFSAIFANDAPVNTINYVGNNFYIQNEYIKEHPERVVFDFGQFASLTNYNEFEQVFSGDANGNPVTAQQVIEQIEPQMKEKIDKFEKALNGE